MDIPVNKKWSFISYKTLYKNKNLKIINLSMNNLKALLL
jgi:hypothetical protein